MTFFAYLLYVAELSYLKKLEELINLTALKVLKKAISDIQLLHIF
jgi:hypothetical protein